MTNAVLQRVYLWGYAGRVVPRWVRRAFAKTGLHRSWFLGFHEYFEQDGTSYGLAKPYPSVGTARGADDPKS